MIENKKKLPDWLRLCASLALLGEIYPNIRMVALKLVNKTLILRYYLDREPTEYDFDSIEVVEMEISSLTTRDEILHSNVECLYSNLPIGKLDYLDGAIYARREYNN
ncbi:MAG: colicin [Candidatus Cloacimonadota bacterium]|nr:MAG: colicin [Candidatus Cloacimonadota bacterium]